MFSGGVGFYTGETTGRAIDIAYWSKERLPEVTEQMCRVAPELAVEIVSPGNTVEDILDKVEEYFAAGVRLVWIVAPPHEKVYVYTSPKNITVLESKSDDALSAEVLLPGFTLPLKELFAKD